ncbi:MAG: hypothetical protein JSV57_00995, partial [Candidatus Bathyarchaeota archaeon]
MSNIAAGIVGSLIIIFFVDKIIDGNSKRERRRILQMVLERLRNPIRETMYLLCGMYKAASKDKPAPLPSTFEETFTDDYFIEVSFLDPRKEAPRAVIIPGGVKSLDWFTYLYKTMNLIRKKIEKILDSYAFYIDDTLMQALEKRCYLKDSSWVNLRCLPLLWKLERYEQSSQS